MDNHFDQNEPRDSKGRWASFDASNALRDAASSKRKRKKKNWKQL